MPKVRELAERYPEITIIVSAHDDSHNGDYLLCDSPELEDYELVGWEVSRGTVTIIRADAKR